MACSPKSLLGSYLLGCLPGSEPIESGADDCVTPTGETAAPGCDAAYAPLGDCAMSFDDFEVGLFASIAQEAAAMAGVKDTEWYILSQTENFDPLYREVIQSKEGFKGPYRVTITLEFDEGEQGQYSQNATDEGVEREYDAIAGVTVTDWCESIPEQATAAGSPREPQEGDVVVVYAATPYPRFFNVLKVSRTGYMGTTGRFIGWRIEFKERKSFSARRRIEPDRPATILKNNT